MIQPDDDEGLIDLRALRLTPRHGPHAAHAATEMAPSPYGRAAYPSPFASEPPPAAFASDATSEGRRGGHRTAIGIFAALVALAALSVGAVLVYRNENAVKAPLIANAVPAVPRSLAVAAPPSAAPPSSPATSASVAASTGDGGLSPATGKKGKKGKGKSKGAGPGRGAKPAPPAPPKAFDPCNCNGDLQCNIKCAAKR